MVASGVVGAKYVFDPTMFTNTTFEIGDIDRLGARVGDILDLLVNYTPGYTWGVGGDRKVFFKPVPTNTTTITTGQARAPDWKQATAEGTVNTVDLLIPTPFNDTDFVEYRVQDAPRAVAETERAVAREVTGYKVEKKPRPPTSLYQPFPPTAIAVNIDYGDLTGPFGGASERLRDENSSTGARVTYTQPGPSGNPQGNTANAGLIFGPEAGMYHVYIHAEVTTTDALSPSSGPTIRRASLEWQSGSVAEQLMNNLELWSDTPNAVFRGWVRCDPAANTHTLTASVTDPSDGSTQVTLKAFEVSPYIVDTALMDRLAQGIFLKPADEPAKLPLITLFATWPRTVDIAAVVPGFLGATVKRVEAVTANIVDKDFPGVFLELEQRFNATKTAEARLVSRKDEDVKLQSKVSPRVTNPEAIADPVPEPTVFSATVSFADNVIFSDEFALPAQWANRDLTISVSSAPVFNVPFGITSLHVEDSATASNLGSNFVPPSLEVSRCAVQVGGRQLTHGGEAPWKPSSAGPYRLRLRGSNGETNPGDRDGNPGDVDPMTVRVVVKLVPQA
jgi:hypothetical protein